MKPEQSPFQTAWMSFDLGEYRPADGTYSFYDYESIPPLNSNSFTGKFHWLLQLNDELAERLSIYRSPDKVRKKMTARLNQLIAQASEKGLTLPPAFVKFMGDMDLQDQIPSCTACYFDLSEKLIPGPFEDGAVIIRFLNDQQDVLLWYLYLMPDGEHCVIVSPFYYDDWESLEGEDRPPNDALLRSTGFCAPEFEEFVYRFWLENKIWFGLNEGEHELSSQELAYINHYKQPE